MKRMSWTLGVPVRNVKTFILYKPPAVIFSLCIACFGLVTLSVGLYINLTATSLKNPDAMSWNDVASKLNKVNFCLLPPEKSQTINTTGMEAVSVPFEMVLPASKLWKNYTLVSGSVAADSLGFNAFGGSNLSFSFSLMDTQTKICLNLYHPVSIPIPQAISSCNALQFNPFPRSTGAVVLPPQEERPNKILASCPDEDLFQLQLKENPSWEVYLDKEDKALVSFRLLATSALLLAIFACMVCYAAVRGGIKSKPLNKSTFLAKDFESDKEPLDP